MKAIINAKIYDYHQYIPHGYLVFDHEIIETGAMSDFLRRGDDEIIDLEGRWLLPGFVAGHTHLYSAFARGMAIDFHPQNFKDVLKQLWWTLDHFLDLDMLYFSALSSGLEQLQAGTTTLIDHHAGYQIKGSLNTIHKAIVDDLGMRAILAFETSDRYDVSAAIDENLNYLKRPKSAWSAGLFGLHASFTLSDETLHQVSQALRGHGIHIHVAESMMDEQETKAKYGLSVVERLAQFKLLNDKSLLVHCAHTSDLELDLINKSKATISLNVTSNMNNGVGLPNLKKMHQKGIKTIIGNDGLIASMPIEYLNAYYTGHLKQNDAVGLSLDVIRQSIIQSYVFVNRLLTKPIGRFEKGYQADMISVDYKPFTPLHQNNVFSHLFYGLFPQISPVDVFVGGVSKIRNRSWQNPLENLHQKAQEAASRLWEKITKEGKNIEFKDNI